MPSYVHVGAHAVGTAAHNIGPGERVDLDADEAEPWAELGVLVKLDTTKPARRTTTPPAASAAVETEE